MIVGLLLTSAPGTALTQKFTDRREWEKRRGQEVIARKEALGALLQPMAARHFAPSCW